MCHVRVNERYRVWHDACHLDDAQMAPLDLNHFDGYVQGPSTLTKYSPGEPVPGLNRGGWHDAGDDDLRVESQAGTMHGLALAWEAVLSNPSLGNDALLAASCREGGITLITSDRDFDRFRPLLGQWRHARPWPPFAVS
jgi:hypothetical protein